MSWFVRYHPEVSEDLDSLGAAAYGWEPHELSMESMSEREKL